MEGGPKEDMSIPMSNSLDAVIDMEEIKKEQDVGGGGGLSCGCKGLANVPWMRFYRRGSGD